MTKAERDALREMEKKATPGPWLSDVDSFGDGPEVIIESAATWPDVPKTYRLFLTGPLSKDTVRAEEEKATTALIVAARNALPGLLDRIEELEAALLKIEGMTKVERDALREPHEDFKRCIDCGGPVFKVDNERLSQANDELVFRVAELDAALRKLKSDGIACAADLVRLPWVDDTPQDCVDRDRVVDIAVRLRQCCDSAITAPNSKPEMMR